MREIEPFALKQQIPIYEKACDMIHWLHSFDELPAQAQGPCVLIGAIGGDERIQRQTRRAWALHMAAQCFGATGLTIGTVSGGALRFFHGETPAPLYLSHATRDGFSAVAVGRQPLGIDLERMGAAFEPAWNILHASERIYLQNLPQAEWHSAFLQIWTAKEAALKLIGTGLLQAPETMEWRGADVFDHVQQRRLHLDIHSAESCICALARF